MTIQSFQLETITFGQLKPGDKFLLIESADRASGSGMKLPPIVGIKADGERSWRPCFPTDAVLGFAVPNDHPVVLVC